MESMHEARSAAGLGLGRWRVLSLGLIVFSALRVEALLVSKGASSPLSLLAIISFLILSPLLLLFLLTIRAKGWPRAVQGAIYAVSCATSTYLLLRGLS